MDITVSYEQPSPNIHDAVEHAGNAARAFLQCREKSRKHVVLRRRVIGCQHRGRNSTAIAKPDCRVKRRVELIGARDGTRSRKGNHAVATGRSDTRTLARKRFSGLVKGIARTVGLILGLTLKFKFFVAAVDVVFQGLFELIEVVFEAPFDRSRCNRNVP